MDITALWNEFHNCYEEEVKFLPRGLHQVLGNYYQPANSPFLDKGSVSNAALAGLFHYTTATNQLKEANSRLDIGLHYVAVDGNGRPLDTDGDGLPDYLEDLNGNGLLSLGETPFGITIDNPLDGSVLTR